MGRKRKGAELVIDDGLLIKDNRILAGISAKREKDRNRFDKNII